MIFFVPFHYFGYHLSAFCMKLKQKLFLLKLSCTQTITHIPNTTHSYYLIFKTSAMNKHLLQPCFEFNLLRIWIRARVEVHFRKRHIRRHRGSIGRELENIMTSEERCEPIRNSLNFLLCLCETVGSLDVRKCVVVENFSSVIFLEL